MRLTSYAPERGQSEIDSLPHATPHPSEPPTSTVLAPPQVQQEASEKLLQTKSASPGASLTDANMPDKVDTEIPASVPPVAIPQKSDQNPPFPLADQSVPASLVEIEYEIFAGENKTLLGTAMQHYESDTSGHYQINYKDSSQNTNDRWQVEIDGNITPKGLSPSTFMRQGSQAQELIALNAGSDGASATESQHSGRMPDGILDRLSMQYQFMHSPPKSNDGTLWLTDGEKTGLYAYHVVGLEPMEIRSQGIVNTMHMILSRNDDPETTELWLAVDFHYLPMKIRRKDLHGNTTEQVAISLTAK